MMSKEYLLPMYKERWYILFSKIAFSEQAIKMSQEDDHLLLFTYQDLFE